MSKPIVDVLATVPLLSGLDRKRLERLARDFTDRTIAAGTVVVREGDAQGVGFFIIAEGEVIVSSGGRELARLGPGSYFGEVALISDRVRTSTVTAATKVRCLVMMLTDFRAFVRTDAEVAWKLLEHVGMLLHSRA
jgi:CRP-like cAMP-binding protein